MKSSLENPKNTSANNLPVIDTIAGNQNKSIFEPRQQSSSPRLDSLREETKLDVINSNHPHIEAVEKNESPNLTKRKSIHSAIKLESVEEEYTREESPEEKAQELGGSNSNREESNQSEVLLKQKSGSFVGALTKHANDTKMAPTQGGNNTQKERPSLRDRIVSALCCGGNVRNIG